MAKEKTEAQKQLELEVKKNLRRIKRFVKSAEKRGYSFSDKAIPNLPKTITKETLYRFQSITPEKLYKKSVYVSPAGTKVKGTERRKAERSEASKKAGETRKRYFESQKETSDLLFQQVSFEPEYESAMVFQQFIEMFESWMPDDIYSQDLKTYKQRDRDRALGIINGARDQLGDTQVAMNIQNNANRLNELAVKILYESGNKYRDDSRNGEINLALNELTAILYGRSLTVSESLILTEISESNEVF